MAITSSNFKIRSIVFNSGLSTVSSSNFTATLFNESGESSTLSITDSNAIASVKFSSLNSAIIVAIDGVGSSEVGGGG